MKSSASSSSYLMAWTWICTHLFGWMRVLRVVGHVGAGTSGDLVGLQKEIIDLKVQVTFWKSQSKLHSELAEDLRERLETAEATLLRMVEADEDFRTKHSVDSLKGQIKQKAKKIRKLERKIEAVKTELQGKIDAVQDELGSALDELGSARDELVSARDELGSARDELGSFKHQQFLCSLFGDYVSAFHEEIARTISKTKTKQVKWKNLSKALSNEVKVHGDANKWQQPRHVEFEGALKQLSFTTVESDLAWQFCDKRNTLFHCDLKKTSAAQDMMTLESDTTLPEDTKLMLKHVVREFLRWH